MSVLKASIIGRRPLRAALCAGAVALVGGLALQLTPSLAEEARVIPPPALDEHANAATETTTFAGGCFWGVQGVFQHVKGVISAKSGYAGGGKGTAQYETVSGGDTGHAESVQVTFDPRKVSYGHLLQIYFSVAHDPTQLNRQGPDTGTQYRSAIFPANDEQARLAKAYIDQLNKAHVFDAAIATRIEPGKAFYPAENYHQDFLTNNPSYPYIVINDLPKIESLKRMFPADYREKPVLVAAAANR
ncbi:peptide-methionine (S)-S-oxide reductase MsrA [Rhizobium sp. S152]|uniref:peptide-methionine (S)-S-oxide reductase MsrA n=1 Tax=Rhizobium sp. S152 TaxID=3055038 RepID=UPI0025A98699|nr:peptide-methionine (S)-S-oxide reductase MsrA [Rhizobium sp. S152]MDM9627914.1 peptide-methionine (S)-S-oxide reductase MsrA [Rhizobium sp. S152]